jgi:branched-chain amino acid transport system substrate-binding protein
MRQRTAAVVVLLIATAGFVAACGSSGSGSGGSGPVVIGASLPMSGPAGSYGPVLRTGYQYAVDQTNAKGGVTVAGAKRKVKLVVLDNKSDPTLAGQQARTLILKNNAVGLLGGLDNVENIPISSVADRQRVPMLTHFAPKQDWLAGNKSGWKYAWLSFFDEGQASLLPFKTADAIKTNRKVALFINNGTGKTFHDYFKRQAAAAGYRVVADDSYTLGNTNFSDAIAKAKAAGAEVVIALGLPPEGIALWKQMKALKYVPKFASCDLCANHGAWQQVLGALAEGTSAFGWWSPSYKYPGTDQIVSAFRGKLGDNEDLTAIVGTSTVAQVLLDAISAADSTDGTKINDEIAKTDKTYTLGPIKFGPDHVATVAAVEKQWHGRSERIVYPADKAQATLQTPVAGLR